jgi:hypothetical protein
MLMMLLSLLQLLPSQKEILLILPPAPKVDEEIDDAEEEDFEETDGNWRRLRLKLQMKLRMKMKKVKILK